MIDLHEFTLLKKRMREKYQSLYSPIHCKCLNQKINLNSHGFHHLLYNGSGRARSIRETRSRLVLIPLIIPVLRLATESSYEKRTVRKSRKHKDRAIVVEMWGLEAEVGRIRKSRIKVIIRRENGGEFYFWSIMRIRT
jgi:hypothetical protein